MREKKVERRKMRRRDMEIKTPTHTREGDIFNGKNKIVENRNEGQKVRQRRKCVDIKQKSPYSAK